MSSTCNSTCNFSRDSNSAALASKWYASSSASSDSENPPSSLAIIIISATVSGSLALNLRLSRPNRQAATPSASEVRAPGTAATAPTNSPPRTRHARSRTREISRSSSASGTSSAPVKVNVAVSTPSAASGPTRARRRRPDCRHFSDSEARRAPAAEGRACAAIFRRARRTTWRGRASAARATSRGGEDARRVVTGVVTGRGRARNRRRGFRRLPGGRNRRRWLGRTHPGGSFGVRRLRRGRDRCVGCRRGRVRGVRRLESRVGSPGIAPLGVSRDCLHRVLVGVRGCASDASAARGRSGTSGASRTSPRVLGDARGRVATRKVSSDRPFSSHASVVRQDGGTCSTERVRESTRRFEIHPSEYVICLGDDDATTGE